jgi:two-component system chemotaxis response regulator CheB
VADEVSVLIVDDSALMRNLIGHMVDETPGLVVGDKAMNGKFALDKIPRVNPDVIVLDLEMPEMNGIEFQKERRKRGMKIPVVILSSIARRGAEITMEALSLGASDFIQKPSGSESADIHVVKDTLVEKLLGYGTAYRREQGRKTLSPAEFAPKEATKPSPIMEMLTSVSPSKVEPARAPNQLRKPAKIEIIAIGISTGGPDALRVVFSQLDAD